MSSLSSEHQTPRAGSVSTGHPTPGSVATPGLPTNNGTTPNMNNGNSSNGGHPVTAQLTNFAPTNGGAAPTAVPSGRPVTAPRLSESSMQMAARIPNILPHERVFPIQIGCELFKLSGASLSSDAPSYFSQYFDCQIKTAEAHGVEDIGTAIRTLYIDRDPATFRDISLHLQGYHVQPRDGTHFVRLFADAQFYSLPRLISQLYDESIFMSIGHREFQIPRDLFQDPGNLPNYFSLGFAIFFSSPDDLFPGLDREGLIRPPSILPPAVPGRSADTFEELLHLLRGYPVHIRDETHRQTLLRDCRYFNFKGLEQKLIPHALTYNQARLRYEMALRVEDVLKSGVSVANEPTRGDPLAGWVNYARPFVDDKPAELVLEIGGENTKLHFFPPASSPAAASPAPGGGGRRGTRAEFFRDTKIRIARLFEVVATKLNLPPTTQPLGLLMRQGGARSQPPSPGNTPLSDDLVRVVLEPETAITLDGRPFALPETVADDTDAADAILSPSGGGEPGPSRKRRRVDYAALSGGANAAWTIKTGLWRLRIQSVKNGKSAVECVLVGVKLDAISSELARNQERGFLGG
ncbi:K+ channel tetramerization domain containing protein [Sporothrix brasiliensis 5110]|uniref:K+ channel tetramerization domain containing protein n=1 Tax=Sporothrix brasiliensis 5110 TaxID=1398154 RepID=A0A0C2J0S3_9PEZI|nr:K+ channel tetramerization domain containing protein [Sporothrix brasiliensis 5110]KIH90747.1 K+ channel tetramerization domain containing protein [Sporothrix brasiliensis 5110]